MPREALLEHLDALKSSDTDWKRGRNFAYVYFAGEEVHGLVQQAFLRFFAENALNPTAFESLRRMEMEVVAMCADLFHGDAETCGNLTGGGTESILMAVHTAREWFRRRGGRGRPQVVLPASAHPAFHKACHYFGLEARVVPLREDFRADTEAMIRALDEHTALVVLSAPSYPHGVVDPIPPVAAAARERGIPCHVDACIGGFLLPFLRGLGRPVPPFDFAVPGVTSLSADLHKYGYAAKGASLLLYRDPEMRKAQFYVYADWPGGIYASPALSGTRPGGAIAAAYAVLRFLGREGYTRLAETIWHTTRRLQEGLQALPGLRVLSDPDMSLFALASEGFDIYRFGDELGLRGWLIDRQQLPPSLHFSVTPAHVAVVDAFLEDAAQAHAAVQKTSLESLGTRAQVAAARALARVLPRAWQPAFLRFAARHAPLGGKRSAALYGMMGELQPDGNLDALVREFLHRLLRP
ncbi:MAG: aspartate aminotransferase family protein [Bacteroidetes bacterium]|nr:MAG: aspartate aminotransferase family protein [Bacteroidota bacterium]